MHLTRRRRPVLMPLIVMCRPVPSDLTPVPSDLGSVRSDSTPVHSDLGRSA
jgi:hypothetical protein